MQSPLPSKRLKILLGLIVLLILLCLSFLAGTKTGVHRSRHFCNWSQQYPEMMRSYPGNDRRPMLMPMRPMPLPNGVFGRVLSTTGTKLMIEGRDRFEQEILINTSTALRVDNRIASSTDIQPNMEVGVFGTPNDHGQIEAHLIRLFPARR